VAQKIQCVAVRLRRLDRQTAEARAPHGDLLVAADHVHVEDRGDPVQRHQGPLHEGISPQQATLLRVERGEEDRPLRALPLLRRQCVGLGNLEQAHGPRAVVVRSVVDAIAVGAAVVEMTGDHDPLVLELRATAFEGGDHVAVGDDVARDIGRERDSRPGASEPHVTRPLRGSSHCFERALHPAEERAGGGAYRDVHHE